MYGLHLSCHGVEAMHRTYARAYAKSLHTFGA